MIGAPQPLVLAKPAAIDTAQAARYFGARGEPDDRTMTLLETCAMPLLRRQRPGRSGWKRTRLPLPKPASCGEGT